MAEYPVWPISIDLSCVLRNSFRYVRVGDNVIRTQMDAGPERRRRRSTSRLEQCTGALTLSEAGVQVLEDFYDITVAELLPFRWFDLRRPISPSNVAVYRFNERPEFAEDPVLGRWRATLDLQLLSSNAGRFLLDVSDGTTGLTNT